MTPSSGLSLRQFLSTARSKLSAAHKVTFVVGNQSEDLDSFASSVVYSYLSWRTRGCSDVLIPLLNIPRRELALRPEFEFLLNRYNVSSSSLVFVDDIAKSLELPCKTAQKDYEVQVKDASFVLVDHNSMDGVLQHIENPNVIGIIDHHKDEKAFTGQSPRIIEKSGSCSSLVVDYFKDKWKEVLTSCHDEGQEQVAELALSAILIDTWNLQDKGKVTNVDIEVVEFLCSIIHKVPIQQAIQVDTKPFFESVANAKGDIDSFSIYDLLCKDFKQWIVENTSGKESIVLGFSTIPKSLEWVIKDKRGGPEGLVKAINERTLSGNLDGLVIMTSFSDEANSFHRQILFFWNPRDKRTLASCRIKTVLEECSKEFQLEPIDHLESVIKGISSNVLGVYNQKNLKASRKQVAPLIRDLLKY